MQSHPNYDLFEEIGAGAETVVRRAYDRNLRRYVAVKYLKEELASDARRSERFVGHARYLAGVEHDGLLQVHSLESGAGWIVMELMAGSLKTKLAEGAITPELARSILKQTLEALQYLHEQGQIHAKVRPSNILVNDQGRVKLSDFEQCSFDEEMPQPSGDGKYSAPELLRPEMGEVGPVLDLYCLGFTILELLAGPKFIKFFAGRGHEIDAHTAWMRWHGSEDELPPATELIPRLPADLGAALDKMLRKRVTDRAASAAEVLAMLEDGEFAAVRLANQEGDAPPPPPPAPENTNQQDSGGSQSPQHRPPKNRRPKPPGGNRIAQYTDLNNPKVFWSVAAMVMLIAAAFGLWLVSPDDGPLKVKIVTEPKADIFIGERQLAVLEDGASIYRLPPGDHTLRFEADGFDQLETKVSVSDKQRKFGPFKLDRIDPVEVAGEKPGEDEGEEELMRIVFDLPPHARLFINDKLATPLEPGGSVYEAPIGQIRIRIEVDGVSQLATVDIGPGTTKLTPFISTDFRNLPEGGEVLVDDRRPPLDQDGKALVALGRHSVKVVQDGEVVAEQKVDIGPNSRVIDLKLPTPDKMEVELAVSPADAEGLRVQVNGQPAAVVDGIAKVSLPLEGEIQVDVAAKDFEAWERKLRSQDFIDSPRLDVELQPRPAPLQNVAFKIVPGDAQGLRVLVDGKPVTSNAGKFEVAVAEDRESPYPVEVMAANYEPWVNTYTAKQLLQASDGISLELKPTIEQVSFRVVPATLKAPRLLIDDEPLSVNEGMARTTIPRARKRPLHVILSAEGFERLEEKYAVSEVLGQREVVLRLTRKTSPADELLQLAKRQMSDQQFQEAVGTYGKALKIQSDLHAARSDRARAHSFLGDFSAAITDLRTVLKAKPNAADFTLLGHAFSDSGEQDEAIDAYDQALQLKSTHVPAHMGAALASLRKKDWRGVVGRADDALKHSAKNSLAFNLQGIAWQELDDTDAALSAFSSAIDADERNHEAYFNRGMLRWSMVDTAGEIQGTQLRSLAIKDFTAAADVQRALGLAGELSQTTFRLGEALASRGDWKEAVGALLESQRSNEAAGGASRRAEDIHRALQLLRRRMGDAAYDRAVAQARPMPAQR